MFKIEGSLNPLKVGKHHTFVFFSQFLELLYQVTGSFHLHVALPKIGPPAPVVKQLERWLTMLRLAVPLPPMIMEVENGGPQYICFLSCRETIHFHKLWVMKKETKKHIDMAVSFFNLNVIDHGTLILS